jgi:hypothetical protein
MLFVRLSLAVCLGWPQIYDPLASASHVLLRHVPPCPAALKNFFYSAFILVDTGEQDYQPKETLCSWEISSDFSSVHEKTLLGR